MCFSIWQGFYTIRYIFEINGCEKENKKNIVCLGGNPDDQSADNKTNQNCLTTSS